MAIPHLGPFVRVTAPIVMTVLLVGCGDSGSSTPDVDQVGHAMQTQILKLQLATTVTDSRVTDELFDKYVPCGNGKVKVTYAVTGRPTTYATGSSNSKLETRKTAMPKQIIDDLVGYLPELGTFTVAERTPDGSTVKLVNAETHTRLTLSSPGRDRLTLYGETDCLKRGPSNQ
jgi:hypothetical protein